MRKTALYLATLTLQQARRLVIFVIGATVVLLGVVMLVTPGPGIAAILLGLAILALEFAWARHILREARAHVGQAGTRLRERINGRATAAGEATRNGETGPDDRS